MGKRPIKVKGKNAPGSISKISKKKKETPKKKNNKNKSKGDQKNKLNNKINNNNNNHVEEEETEIGEEDIEFFKEHGKYISFLDSSGVLTKENESFEKKGNNIVLRKDKKKPKKIEEKQYSEKEEEEKMDFENLPQDDETLELYLFQKRQERLKKKKEEIALYCSLISTDPYKNLGQIENLQKLCSDSSITIQKYAILSECAIFRDLIPDYRIRVNEQEETQISKEVRALREYEKSFLSYYQKYLKSLESITQDKTKKSISTVAVRSMCTLLETHPHFNFGSNIISTIIPLLKTSDDEIFDVCFSCLKFIFSNSDTQGEVTLECTKAIAQLVKSKNFNLREKVLDTFLHLNLTQVQEVDILGNKTNEKKKKKDKKKKDKEEHQLEKELKESEAVQDKKIISKQQSEILKIVFLTYFRILKKAHNSSLLPSVLRGLGKFAHLINVEVVSDVLSSLKSLFNSENVSITSQLHAVVAAFQTLKNHEDLLRIDLKDFYTKFYNLLPNIVFDLENTESYLQCLGLMFLAKKQVGIERTASFAKRLANLALYVPPNVAITFLLILHSILSKFPRTQQLLDSETIGIGIYLPDCEEPEHSNAFASNLVELSLLQSHYHPVVAKFAKEVASGEDSIANDLYVKSLPDILNSFDTKNGTFNPTVHYPPANKLKRKRT